MTTNADRDATLSTLTSLVTSLVETIDTQGERIDAILDAAAPTVPQAAPRKAKAKTQTMAIRRKSDALVCTAHKSCGKNNDRHFATPSGAAYHVAHSGGAFKA